MAATSQTTFSNVLDWKSLHWNLFPGGALNNRPSLDQIMAWRRAGDEPLFEPIYSWPTYLCISQPRWVKSYFTGTCLMICLITYMPLKQSWLIWVDASLKSYKNWYYNSQLDNMACKLTKHCMKRQCFSSGIIVLSVIFVPRETMSQKFVLWLPWPISHVMDSLMVSVKNMDKAFVFTAKLYVMHIEHVPEKF